MQTNSSGYTALHDAAASAILKHSKTFLNLSLKRTGLMRLNKKTKGVDFDLDHCRAY